MEVLSSTGGRAPWRFGLTGLTPIVAQQNVRAALNAL